MPTHRGPCPVGCASSCCSCHSCFRDEGKDDCADDDGDDDDYDALLLFPASSARILMWMTEADADASAAVAASSMCIIMSFLSCSSFLLCRYLDLVLRPILMTWPDLTWRRLDSSWRSTWSGQPALASRSDAKKLKETNKVTLTYSRTVPYVPWLTLPSVTWRDPEVVDVDQEVRRVATSQKSNSSSRSRWAAATATATSSTGSTLTTSSTRFVVYQVDGSGLD